jgi:transposase
LDAYLADEETIEEIAARFNVGRTTVVKWVALYRETGSVAPRKTKPGPPSTITPKQIAVLRKIIARRPDLTYDELTERWNRALGTNRHRSTTVRVVLALGYTLKKKTIIPTERNSERVQALREAHEVFQRRTPGRRLIFLDEAGATLAMTRLYGRAIKGQEVHDTVPRNRGRVTTMIGAMSAQGIVAMATVEAATDGAVFLAFLDQVLIPVLKRGDILVWDNLGAHKLQAVRDRLAAIGVRVVFLPPYSPDLNPIELFWAWLKAAIRRERPRTRSQLDRCIAAAMDQLPPTFCQNWFRECGYRASRS